MDDSDSMFPTAVHPVVRTHPETGRKALFVNRTFTTKINGLSADESDSILTLLFDQAEHINHQIRFSWAINDMAFGITAVVCTVPSGITGQKSERSKGHN